MLKLLTPFPAPTTPLDLPGRRCFKLVGRTLVILAVVWGTGETVALQRAEAQQSDQADQALIISQAAIPATLQNTLSQIDAAASQENLQGVLQFYSANFRHSDGLTRQSLGQALAAFWKQYDRLNYQTEVQSWQRQGNGWTATTVTQITGVQKQPNRTLQLNATLMSRQRMIDQTIVSQEILSETTQVTSGTNPPELEFRLPDQVKVGQTYNFDAIVKEPLGTDMLLGAALEEPITARNYLEALAFKLEVLPAGGLFKVGEAPTQPSDRWISAVVIREDGLTIQSQRLKVTGQTSAASTLKP